MKKIVTDYQDFAMLLKQCVPVLYVYHDIILHMARKWNDADLRDAVQKAYSIRQVIKFVGLVPAGGNYVQVQQRIKELKLDTSHFRGQGWSKGQKVSREPLRKTEDILKEGVFFESYKLKRRLFKEGLKNPECEICGWNKMSEDGRIPVELDHINGERNDNRLSNLRILCPNCHSLQLTHRGKNMKKCRGGGIGRHEGLKHP